MASLDDLIKFGQDLQPLLEPLFELASDDEDLSEAIGKRQEKVLGFIEKLVNEANRRTKLDRGKRGTAIMEMKWALEDILDQASTSNVALSKARRNAIRRMTLTLDRAFAQVREKAVFEDVARLLTADEIRRFGDRIERGFEAVRQRQRAQRVLNAVVDVAVTGARIAAKLV